MTVALLPADALLGELGELPPGLEVALLDPDGSLPDDVRVLVASFSVRHQIPDVIPKLPGLELIQSIHAGVEPLLALVPHGVTLANGSGVHDVAVAEWVLAVILHMRRLQDHADAEDLEGATVLVIGHGSIGRRVEHLLAPFGATVRGVARNPRPGVATPAELPELVPQADVIVALTPHTPETERLVDGEFLARMRPGALLVNAGRGAVVDTGALIEALRAGHIRAALDVTDPEPLPPDHPLRSAPGLLLTPHIAGSTRAWQRRAYRFVGDQLRRYAAGEPLLNIRTTY